MCYFQSSVWKSLFCFCRDQPFWEQVHLNDSKKFLVASVKMEQNPQQNDTSPNIETGKSWFFLFLKILLFRAEN